MPYQGSVDFLGATEIGKFAAAGLIDEDVGCLDVSVNDIVDVQVFYTL